MVVAEVVSERGLRGGDGKGNEGGTDDAKHELQLTTTHGGGLRARMLVMVAVAQVGTQHPGLDEVGVAEELVATGAASGPVEGCKHLLGDGHLQHRLQPVLAIQIRTKLSHIALI